MAMDLPYRDRSAAGRQLAAALAAYKSKPDVIVLGLTRGGVPVAAEVATALQAPLDVIVVRKLGVPVEPELAMGAIAGDDVQVLDREIIRVAGVSDEEVQAAVQRERRELERREKLYRGGRLSLDLKDHIAVIVDDGLATGSTMLAAVAFARKRLAKRVVMAVPVASVQAREKLREKTDECVCLAAPDPFFAVGDWYVNFLPTSDAEVLKLLEESARRTQASITAG